MSLDRRLDRLESRDRNTIITAWICPICGVADTLGFGRDCATHIPPPMERRGETRIIVESVNEQIAQ